MEEKNTGTQTVENLAKEPPEELAEQANAETQKAGGRKAIISAFDKAEIEFVKPLTWCGKIYEKASLDFSKLTGVDMEAIDEELGNESPAFPAQSRKYQKLLAAKASHIPSDAIEHLAAADYNAVIHAAQLFLVYSG